MIPTAEQLEDRDQPSAATTDFISLDAAPLAAAAIVRPEIVPPAPRSEVALGTVTRHELLLIARDVPDREALVRGAIASRPPGTSVEVVELTGGGISEISAVLARYHGLDAVHLVTHGEAGALDLGADQLDATTIDEFATDLRAWGSALHAGADLLLYGCDFADTAEGRVLTNRIAALTGADVAASTDPTGAAALGGDWELEYRTGSVETAIAAVGNWAHTLGTPASALWISTTSGTTTVPPAHGGTSWGMAEAISFGDPNLALGAGTTSGTFSKVGFNLNNFVGDGAANLNGFHYVSHALTVGGAHAVALQPGDLLISVAQSEVLGGVAVGAADIALFRPTTPGDYASGTFSVLLQAPLGNTATRDFALVETPTVVGGVALNPGDFLLTAIQSAYRRDVTRFQAADVGVGTTSGTISTLLDGSSAGLNFGHDIFGLELVQQTTTLGGVTLTPGQFLLSLSDNDRVGTNALDLKKNDVFVLTVGATGVGTSSGSAAFLVHGTDVGLSDGNAVYDALALAPDNSNVAPIANNDSYATNEDAPLATGAAGGVLNNDSDAGGNTLIASLATGPANGTVAVNSDGGFIYTPNANFFGTDSFTYAVSDGRGGTATATVTVTVNPVNDAPTFSIAGNPSAVDEDSGPQVVAAFATGMSPGPAGESGQALTFQVTGDTNPGLFASGPSVAPDGTLTYTPAADANGTATITLVLRDDGGTANGGQDTSIARTFTITVRSVNDAPTFNTIGNVTVAEDSGQRSVAVHGLTAGGGESQTLAVTATSNNPAIVPDPTVQYASPSATATLRFTPVANANGTVTITVTVRDAGDNGFLGDADDAVTIQQFTVTVTPVPDPPVANPDTYSTGPLPLVVALGNGVLTNDTDADGDALSAALVSGPSNGVLLLLGDGSFTYTPNPGFNGVDTFTYQATDSTNLVSAPATVAINVALGNRPPTAGADAFTTSEDVPLSGSVLGNDSDPDGDPLTLTLLGGGPANGTLALNPDGTFTYTPAPNFSGSDSFAYTLSDGHGGTATATVTLTVTPTNDPPQAAADTGIVAEDGSVMINVRANDTDAENDPLSVVAVTQPANGVASTDGVSVTYTPNPDFNGSDSFTYTVSDGNGGTATATVTVNVTAVNDPPTLDPIANVTIAEDAGAQTVALTGITAGGGETQNLTITATSSDPTLIPNPTVVYTSPNTTGTLNFAPAPDANGTATITVTVSDGVTTTSRTFVVAVVPVNDAPTISPIPAQSIAEDGSLGPLAFTVGDLETRPDALVVTATSGNQSLVPDANITITPTGGGGRQLALVPAANANGTAVITLTVSDGSASTTTTFALTVTPVPDAPTAANDDYTTASGQRLAAPPSVLLNDTDADGDPLDAVLVSDVQHGTLRLNPDGSFVYDPDPGFVGADSFTYRAVDSTGAVSATATVTINVVVPVVAPQATPEPEPATPAIPEPSAPADPPAAPKTAPAPRIAPAATVTPAPVNDSNADRAGNSRSEPNTTAGTVAPDAPVIGATIFLGAGAPPTEPAAAAPPATQPAVPDAPQAPRMQPEATPVAPAQPTAVAPAVATPLPVQTPVAEVSPVPDVQVAVETVADGLDKVSRDVAAEADERATTDAVVTTAVAATAGYALLNTRAVYWFISALLARPAVWSRFDPIDVICSWDEEQEPGTGSDGAAPPEDESLQSMVG